MRKQSSYEIIVGNCGYPQAASKIITHMNDKLEKQHRDMVRLLAKDPGVIAAQMNPLKAGLIHAALGIAGEVGEMDKLENNVEHLLEECGDLLFYCRDFRDRAGLMPYVEGDMRRTGVLSRLMIHMVVLLGVARKPETLAWCAGVIVDYTKKLVIYNRVETAKMRDKVYYAIDELELAISRRLSQYGFTRADALKHNIDKLIAGPGARYASGYSDEAAAARVDKLGKEADT